MQTKTNGRSLPKGWQWVKLGDLALGGPDNGIFKRRHEFGHGTPLINVSDLFRTLAIDISQLERVETSPKELAHYAISVGDLFFCRSSIKREGVGWCAYVSELPEPAVFDSHVMRLTPDTSRVLPEFIAYYWQMPSVRESVIANAKTATMTTMNQGDLTRIEIPIPPLDEQRQIASRLNEQLAAVESARKAAEEQLELSNTLINAYLKRSLSGSLRKLQLKDGFVEVKKGVGKTWAEYPVLGTTRYGVAPAKEKVGKTPERYKLVEPGTIFYNPMRINIGSIAMLDEGDTPGITSPDYVVMNSVKDVIHPRWFYYWLRSPYGEDFIKTYARGAVRERMMFTRLAPAYLEIPSYEVQANVAEKLLGIKQLQSAIESQLAEIDSLPASLLREAFAGQCFVT